MNSFQAQKYKTGNSKSFYSVIVKRIIDFCISFVALTVLSPVIALVAIAVRCKLGAPVLFTQDRVGLNEKVFRIYKFRTMTNETDAEGQLLPDDQRFTKFGKLLRATSLDELPQLFCIIKGDMSIVGPRPLLVKYIDRYGEREHRRHLVRPGLTSYAMSMGRNSLGWDKKFELDEYYVDHLSLGLDIKTILNTIKIVIMRKGINEDGFATNSEYMGSITDAHKE